MKHNVVSSKDFPWDTPIKSLEDAEKALINRGYGGIGIDGDAVIFTGAKDPDCSAAFPRQHPNNMFRVVTEFRMLIE